MILMNLLWELLKFNNYKYLIRDENDKRIHIEDNASMSFIKSQELDITNSSFTNENLLKPDFTIINKNKLLKIGKEKNYLTYKQSNKTYDKEPNFYYYKR